MHALIELRAGDEMLLPTEASPSVFTCIDGGARLSANGSAVELTRGETAVMLADAPPVQLIADRGARVLRGWIEES